MWLFAISIFATFKTWEIYRITIQARDNDVPVLLWVTEAGEMPLAEYTDLSVDGSSLEGQILSGITYRSIPLSKKTLLFLVMTWTGIWMAIFYVFSPDWQKVYGKICRK